MYLIFFHHPSRAAADSFIINVAPFFKKKNKHNPHPIDILHYVPDIPWPRDDPDILG